MLLVFIYALGLFTGYTLGLAVAPSLERQNRHRLAQQHGNGHQASEPVPPVQTDPLAHTTDL